MTHPTEAGKSKLEVNPIDVIKRAYAETEKLNFGDPENEKHKALHLLNEVQDILGIYLEGEHKMWKEEYAQQTEQPWVRVSDRLPTEDDSYDDYNEVLTIQIGRQRPTMMKYSEIKHCPFTTHWMKLPSAPPKS